ncbi:hypothetical protein BBO_04410 [Beauveria brongniartii RCEF 3172]|uniref:Uncharacterized protein n=1 Tax=Beauveria brongniartii RCEF 3172 TaxID=1081107 RepID=A0A167EK46_9HYPO|nr:hypothetical protein BBO_04410 [Beauveria brongniartii RCEF 3172]
MAAGYALPGAYERLYFYYAYRLGHMTNVNPTIATGCKGRKGALCGLNEFMEYASKTSIKVSITTAGFPDVKKIAEEIHAKGLNGQIEPPKSFKITRTATQVSSRG